MPREVKGRRRYDSTRRATQAQETRAAILEAARARFLTDGYAATTMAVVATDAGVSVETVYKAFANKPGLVKAIFDVAVVGDDEPIPLVQREAIARITEQADPRDKLRAYGDHLAVLAPRAYPVQQLVRTAAANDGGAEQLWVDLQAERLAGMTAFATHLSEAGHLRDGVSIEHARDVLWVHNSPDLWHLLVNERGWTDERYGRWVAEQLIAALLD